MNDRTAFRRAIESHDLDALIGLFRELLLAEVQPRLMAALQADSAAAR